MQLIGGGCSEVEAPNRAASAKLRLGILEVESY
jgi:hypothetical protein